MTYTEIQKRGGRKYYYLAHTVRSEVGFKKIRVFLGVNLSTKELQEKIRRKGDILKGKVSVIEESLKERFVIQQSFSKRLLPPSQLEKLERLQQNYHQKIKLTDEDILRKVRESFLISYTYNTNAAEGNTITLKETELILKRGIIPKAHALREVYEIENTVRAYEFIEKYTGALTHAFILTLHKMVTLHTLTNAKNEGRYRVKGQNVAMLGSKHFPPKGGRNIKRLMGELIMRYQTCRLSHVEAAIQFHSAFISIHPFIDGNGRVSRLVFNWMLLRANLPPIDFPSENHIEYTDLMEVSRDGDSVPLADYLFDRISSTMR
ncbi:Fic family protein [Candidatus Woesearchaeota archaeon]|nr:Fic family protein [Candidatus Woesearchaeota archaeon]